MIMMKTSKVGHMFVRCHRTQLSRLPCMRRDGNCIIASPTNNLDAIGWCSKRRWRGDEVTWAVFSSSPVPHEMNFSSEGTGAKRCRPLLALEGMRIDYSNEWRSYESIRIQGFNEGKIMWLLLSSAIFLIPRRWRKIKKTSKRVFTS